MDPNSPRTPAGDGRLRALRRNVAALRRDAGAEAVTLDAACDPFAPELFERLAADGSAADTLGGLSLGTPIDAPGRLLRRDPASGRVTLALTLEPAGADWDARAPELRRAFDALAEADALEVRRRRLREAGRLTPALLGLMDALTPLGPTATPWDGRGLASRLLDGAIRALRLEGRWCATCHALSREGNLLVLTAHAGEVGARPRRYLEADRDAGVLFGAIRRRRPILARHTAALPPDDVGPLYLQGRRDFLVVPILTPVEVSGVLALESSEPGTFRPAHAGFLLRAASLAAAGWGIADLAQARRELDFHHPPARAAALQLAEGGSAPCGESPLVGAIPIDLEWLHREESIRG